MVLTGTENAGKTTLVQGIASALNWEVLPEAARTDSRVIGGTVDRAHLQQMLLQFNDQLTGLMSTAPRGIVCDTGGLVLEMWSRHAFEAGLEGTEDTMDRAHLHLLCHTLPDWEPDPLRTMPRHADRLKLQTQYRTQLIALNAVFCELGTANLDDRLAEAIRCIHQHCAP